MTTSTFVRAGRADDRVGQLGEIVLPQLGDRQADDAGAPGAQTARRQIGPVVQLGDRREHALAGGGRTCG